MAAPDQPSVTGLSKDALGGQASREEHHRQAGARVSAAAHEVEVVVMIMAVVGPQIAHLQEVVAEAERGALLKVVQAQPVTRRVAQPQTSDALADRSIPVAPAAAKRLISHAAQGLPVLRRASSRWPTAPTRRACPGPAGAAEGSTRVGAWT